MKQRKAQFFDVILVFTVLIGGSLMVGAYVHNSKKIQSSLVSPSLVSKEHYANKFLEKEEIISIRECLAELSETQEQQFKSPQFRKAFLDCFSQKIIKKKIYKFFLENMSLNQETLSEENLDVNSFVKNKLYKISLKDGAIVLSRNPDGDLQKIFELKPITKSSINFPVDFIDNIQKNYTIKFEDLNKLKSPFENGVWIS